MFVSWAAQGHLPPTRKPLISGALPGQRWPKRERTLGTLLARLAKHRTYRIDFLETDMAGWRALLESNQRPAA